MYHGGVGEELWAMVMTVEEELEGEDGGRGRRENSASNHNAHSWDSH